MSEANFYKDKILGRERKIFFTQKSIKWLKEVAGYEVEDFYKLSDPGTDGKVKFYDKMDIYSAILYAGIINDSDDLENGIEDVLNLSPVQIQEIVERGPLMESLTTCLIQPELVEKAKKMVEEAQKKASGKKSQARKKK